MTQRKKGKVESPRKDAGNPLPPPATPYPEAGCDANSDEYYRGRRDAMAQVNERAEERKAEKAKMEEIANSRISIEFGDNTITFRDGLDRIIKREGFRPDWATKLGTLMAERGCTNIGCRLGEHALFTARGVYKDVSAQKSEAARHAGIGPGMDFGQRGGLGGREIS